MCILLFVATMMKTIRISFIENINNEKHFSLMMLVKEDPNKTSQMILEDCFHLVNYDLNKIRSLEKLTVSEKVNQ